MSDEGLTEETRLLVDLSVAVAVRDWMRLDRTLVAAEREPARRVAVEEALLQSYLFLGYPAALTALALWREIAGSPAADADPLATPSSLAPWVQRGEEVCEVVYGRAYDKLRRNIARTHPAMDRWMVAEGYGKVLGRPGLSLQQRELCIVAILAASAWEPQLHSHLRGALHAGASGSEISEALEIGLSEAGAGSRDRVREMWRRIVDAHDRERPDVR